MEGGNREVVKASLGFIKVAAVRLPQAELAAQLPSLVPALLAPCDTEDGFNRFRSKVRVVVERLVKRCGWQAVEAVTPELHSALLQHMRRAEIRNEKRRKASVAGSEFGGGRARTEAGRSARTGRKSAWNDAEVFSDDDEGTKFGGRRKIHRRRRPRRVLHGANVPSRGWWRRAAKRGGGARPPRGGRRAPSGIRGRRPNPRSPRRLRHASPHARPARRRRRRLREDDRRGYARGEGGRLVITEEREYAGKRKREDDDDDGRSVGARSNVSRRTAKTQGTMRSGKTARTTKTTRTTRSGKTARGENRHSADVYRAKKGARGDAQGKDRKLEPYAYWQLDPKLLNRRASKGGGEGRVGESGAQREAGGDSPRAKGEGFRVTRGRDGRRRGVAECDSFERFRRVSSVRSRRRLSSSRPAEACFFTQ